MVFPVVMYGCELDYKESWALKNWCFWTVVLERTLKSPLDSKEIKPVSPKGNQSWIFIARTDAEAEVPILWPLDAKNWLIGKDPDAGKDWIQEKKGTTEDEMVEWHHWLNGHEFEQAPGVGDRQESLACCSPWVAWTCKESDTTWDWTELKVHVVVGEGKNVWKHLSWTESPKKPMVHIWPSVVQNGTLFGNRVFVRLTRQRWGHKVGPNPK